MSVLGDREKRQKARLYGFVCDLKNGKPCTDCGVSYEAPCMEFDHLSAKTCSVSSMVEKKASRARILAEVAKTEIVCILCHRLRSFERREVNIYRRSSLRERMVSTLIARAKARPCETCGVRRHRSQMDFDHLDPSTKLFGIADAPRKSAVGPDEVRAEMAKCRLICALCHRRSTSQGIYLQRVSDMPARHGLKVTPGVVARVHELKSGGASQGGIAQALNLSPSVVSEIVRGKYTNTSL